MNNLELYYDHYKDSNQNLKESQKRRNISFIALCLLETLSFLMIYIPDIICVILNAGINQQFNSDVHFSVDIIQTFIWLLIAYIFVRYAQDTVYIERQYNYIAHLEKAIRTETESNIFNREGETYLSDYPAILNFIDLFYKMFSPILFTIINIARIQYEWYTVNEISFICDLTIFTVIFCTTWLYFFYVHSKISRWFRRNRIINYLATKTISLLREV